jgi:tryptophan halogenase
VLGGGTAGLVAALTLKSRCPQLEVDLVRSREIGVIGVGEGTIGGFNRFFFHTLGLDVGGFYRLAEPTWKLGIRLCWGRRRWFNYVFVPQCDWRWNDQALANGFYCRDDFRDVCLLSALMDRDKACALGPSGEPVFDGTVFHIQNALFVRYLETVAAERGVRLHEDTLSRAEPGDRGIAALHFESGAVRRADLYVDASGFGSILLGRTLGEPFEDFSSTLPCDRALVGTWGRAQGETIRPYTTAETMQAGWCWRIDHERHVNRGYVYASAFLDDEEAERELREANPRLGETRLLRFRSGHHRRAWVGNVVAVGNACGFVEPLEATAIQMICVQSKQLAETLFDGSFAPGRVLVGLYNASIRAGYASIRDFLGVHYRLNDRVDTPFWKTCRSEVELGPAAELLAAYRETGPAIHRLQQLVPRTDLFGLEGYLTMFVGFGVPYAAAPALAPADLRRFEAHRAQHRARAEQGLDARQALARIRAPDWVWAAP